MVLSLVDLSLRSITKGIEDGTIRHPYLLPPNLRERVFDTAIKQGLDKHPNGLELLTSIEFLNGVTSISANASTDSDLVYLERLVASLATKLPNGEMVGATVKQLNLKVYDYGVEASTFKNKKTYSAIISKVSDLIAQCPNTASLVLHLSKKPYSKEGYCPLNENGNIACNRVMQNLINLSVVCNGERILDKNRPIINFKQLKTLNLENCSFDGGTWPKLLEKIPLLENLYFFQVNSNQNGLDWILPFPLPHLKSLKVLGGITFKCNNAFVNKLMGCKQLRQVHLTLDEKSTDEESLVRLANMDIDLKMRILLFVRGNDAAENASILDSSSRFKLVRIFHESLESFELTVWFDWNAQFSTALEDVVKTCSNLASFGIIQPRFHANQPQIDPIEETRRFNAALIRFLSSPERAQQLKCLRLDGNIDETVLSTVFECCPNLVRLDIRHSPTLRDQHLIDWVSRGDGGKLTDLIVEECKNVTSEGIIPILAKSAEGLLRVHFSDLNRNSDGGRNWKTVLRNRCPNAIIDNVYPIFHNSIP